jgi:hypothetical protein
MTPGRALTDLFAEVASLDLHHDPVQEVRSRNEELGKESLLEV